MQVRASFVAGGASLVLVALAVVLAVKGCGPSLPSTPRELFAQVQAYQAQGEMGKIWDLFTPERREAEMKGIDGLRETLKKNPGARNLVKQYHVTYDEFLRLPDVEIFRREHEGYEGVLVNATVTDEQRDPRYPDIVALTIHLETGAVFTMHARQVDGGWRLIDLEPQTQGPPQK